MLAKLKKTIRTGNLTFYTADTTIDLEIPQFTTRVAAGFPSPADDYIDLNLDLNKHLVRNPSATFYVRVAGHSMIEAGIHDGDLLIIDRSVEPQNGDIVLGVIDGEFTVKRLVIEDADVIFLKPENGAYKPIQILDGMNFRVWGVVTYNIRKQH